ncbi:MAG: hypothetical protein F4213_13145 [Boseongicola sp. SB0677_bin_26]|nr:hypothetical protein [Boseongicola sp. SB0665_bin_10]MYG26946.1 hypothetical protein [Boseongicola sp. SB0677_bin_26]
MNVEEIKEHGLLDTEYVGRQLRNQAHLAIQDERRALKETLSSLGVATLKSFYEGRDGSGNVTSLHLEPEPAIRAGQRDPYVEHHERLFDFVWSIVQAEHPEFEDDAGGEGILAWDLGRNTIRLDHTKFRTEFTRSNDVGGELQANFYRRLLEKERRELRNRIEMRMALRDALLALGVANVKASYQGHGGGGNVTDVGYEPAVGLPANFSCVEEKLMDFVWDTAQGSYPGFEERDGGHGTVRWNLAKDELDLEHSTRSTITHMHVNVDEVRHTVRNLNREVVDEMAQDPEIVARNEGRILKEAGIDPSQVDAIAEDVSLPTREDADGTPGPSL